MLLKIIPVLNPYEIRHFIAIEIPAPNILRNFLITERQLIILLSAISHILNALPPSLKSPFILLLSIHFFWLFG